MYQILLISLCAIHFCWGQSFNSPPLDWIQTDGTGAYRFGYATGDEGRHYHVSSATADNTVAGRFGYKDPATGGDLQTTYTAGRRGFRARGPHIARRMDLSQTKPPFSRPDDDGQYHPELDNYFDPNEDRGYDFSYRTPDHIKEEHADRAGDVQGRRINFFYETDKCVEAKLHRVVGVYPGHKAQNRYSYLDDIGFRHNVEYIAGSKTGFVVTNPVPDTFAQARGGPLYYVGKSGGSKVRGFSAIQKTLSGAYRFLASGPDHKRSEISDASGNRRGVYTYLDDKGVQHTVEYIAGPKIGYKVINNKRGVSYNPVLPYFPDSPTAQPLFPSSAGGGSGNKPLGPTTPSPSPAASDGDLFSPFSPPDGSGFPSFPSGSKQPPSSSPFSPSKPPFSPSNPPPGKPPSNKVPTDVSSGRPPSSARPPSSTSSTPQFPFQQSGDFPSLSSNFPSTSPRPIPAKPQPPPDFEDPSQKNWNYDFDYFFNNPSDSNRDWSKPLNRPSGTKLPTTTPKVPAFDTFPDFSPSPFPDPTYLIPDAFHEGLNTAETGNGLKPPFGKEDKDECPDKHGFGGSTGKGGGDNQKGRSDQGGDGDGSSSGSGSTSKEGKSGGAKHYYKGRKGIYYPSRGTVKFGGVKKTEWHGSGKEDGYFAIPPGVAVRAHVQSLDIVPFKRFESPEEALKQHHDGRREATS